MIVVDTNLVAYLVIPGEHTQLARRALVRDPEWAAPLLLRSELRNVLAVYLKRREIDLDDAIAVQKAGEAVVADREYAIDSSAVLASPRAQDCRPATASSWRSPGRSAAR